MKTFEGGKGAITKNNIRLGVSACLLGEEVRYDGGHKRDRFITDTLADYEEGKARGNLVKFHTRHKFQYYLHPHPIELQLRNHA